MSQQSTKSNQESNNKQSLTQIQNRIFGIDDDDTTQTRIFIQIMREVGGYNQLMEMPILAVKEVYDFLKWESKQFNKKMPKVKK